MPRTFKADERVLSFRAQSAPEQSEDEVYAVPERSPIVVDRMLRLPEVLSIVGIGRTTLYNLVRAGKFPAPLHLSTRIRGWRLSSVQEFLSSVEGE
jgi:predicted DNA-binding transcriptional regulator AlpA